LIVLNTLATYASPLVVFGLVVFVHELGHFLAAKAMGVYAPVFSLGWGKRLFGIRRGETDYRVSMFPLGGYVRMATRDDDAMAGIEGGSDRGELDEPADPATTPLWDANSMAPFGPRPVPPHRWVENKSAPARVLILSAGVIMNILLTLAVSSGVFYTYGDVYRPALIDSVMVGAPAERAGIQPGDRIVGIDGDTIRSWGQVIERIGPRLSGGPVSIEIDRGGQRMTKVLQPQTAEVTDSLTGRTQQVGRIGIYVRDSIIREDVGLGQSIALGSRATWMMATSVTDVLKGLMTREVSVDNLGGPIAIARTSVQAARAGMETFWSLIAFLSLNIAILNLLPIPVLDGGQILLVIAEAIKGREFSTRTREVFARVGIVAVLMLIVLVMYNDIRSLLQSWL
jgi:regulator of sigma E protease